MNKILLSLLLLCTSMSAAAFTSTPYIGPTLFEQDLTTSDANYRGVHPRISIGYMGIFDFYYLALEVFGSPFMLTFSDNHPYEEDSLKVTSQYGASLLPGMLITEELIAYLRLGAVRATFKDPSTIATGYDFGLGLQASLSNAWSLRGEYIYTDYGNINGIGIPRSDQIGIGLIYKFDNA